MIFNNITLSILLVFFVIVSLIYIKACERWRTKAVLVEGSSRAMQKKLLSAHLAHTEKFINDYFKDTEITDQIIKVSDMGQLSIKIGADAKLVSVDLADFETNPIEALEKARMLYKSEE